MLQHVESDLTNLLRRSIAAAAHRSACSTASHCKTEHVAYVGRALILIAEELFAGAPSLGARRMSTAATSLRKRAADIRARGYHLIMPRYDVARSLRFSRREATAPAPRKAAFARAWLDTLD